MDSHNKWSPCEILSGHLDLVLDVSWAPNVGKSFELIATASRDGHVRIFKIKEGLADLKGRKFKVDLIGMF
jgi:nucleoporin SEH1